MNTEELKTLLKRYYDGESTLEEEQKLSDYFSQDIKEKAFEAERLQFLFYHKARQETTERPMHYQAKTKTKVILFHSWWKAAASAAAVTLLAVTGYYLQPETEQQAQLSEEEVRLAYLETKKALLLVSEKLNKGTQPLHQLSKFNSAQQLFTQKTKKDEKTNL